MSNKSCFRGPFNRQHGKWVETLLQSEQQHLLPYLLITVEVITLEKVSFTHIQNPKTVS